MSSHLDWVTAERLLECYPATSHTRLTAVLRAATAPAHVEELTEEGAAASAFRAAAVTEPRRPSLLAKGLIAKLAIVCAATGSTGVALVANGGTLPWTHTPATSPATSPSATPSTPPPVTPTQRPSSEAGKPSAPLNGLCEAADDPNCAKTTTEHPTGRPSDQPTPTAPGKDSARPTEPSRSHTPAPSGPHPSGAATPMQGH
jgi:hypothetical protein